MNKLWILPILLIFSFSLFSSELELCSEDYIPEDIKVEVTINKVELDPMLNDHNTFFLGDDDFEMFISFNGIKESEFELKANRSNKVKRVKLNHKTFINAQEINSSISKRRGANGLSKVQQRQLIKMRSGKICLLDDSLFNPGFLTTSYYGCFDLVNEVQAMIYNKADKKDIFVKKNTTFPVTNDPKKAKFFKTWYTVKVLK